MKGYRRFIDVTSAVASGDLNLTTQRNNESGSNDYNLIPQAIMIMAAASSVEDVVAKDFNGNQVTLKLETNRIYEIGVEEIIKSGTTTETILILGDHYS